MTGKNYTSAFIITGAVIQITALSKVIEIVIPK